MQEATLDRMRLLTPPPPPPPPRRANVTGVAVRRSATLTLLLFSLASSAIRGQATPTTDTTLTELSASQLDSVAQGLLVVQTRQIPHAPWPRIRIARFIAASPEEGAAMLSDYGHQPDYMKQLAWARVVSRPTASSAEVAFKYRVPMAPDIEYTVLDRVVKTPDGVAEVTWRLVKSESLAQAEGSAKFLPWRNPVTGVDGTILLYEHFVVPRSSLARLAPDRMARRDVVNATHAIAAEIERERSRDPTRLNKQVEAFRLATAH